MKQKVERLVASSSRSSSPRKTRPRLSASVALGLIAVLGSFVIGAEPIGMASAEVEETSNKPALRIVVMDPLCNRLACDCVGGYAQRDYERWGQFLRRQLGRPVMITYAEALASPRVGSPQAIDLIVGKYSIVVSDTNEAQLGVRPIAMLSDQAGEVTQTGLFVVRQADPARSIEDLAGRRMRFGPAEADEKHSAARAALEVFGVSIPEPLPVSASCNTAALAVVEDEADVGVISSYAMPLLEGCGTIDPGTLRILGRTDPVPFISVFATPRVDAVAEEAIIEALLAVQGDHGLLDAMESKRGFIAMPDIGDKVAWTDWRGTGRHATSPYVPKRLSRHKQLLWSRVCTGPAWRDWPWAWDMWS